MKYYWETVADKLSKAGWNWGCVSAVDSNGRTIWIADAHRDDRKRFVVRRLDMARLRTRFNVATDEEVEDILMEYGVGPPPLDVVLLRRTNPPLLGGGSLCSPDVRALDFSACSSHSDAAN